MFLGPGRRAVQRAADVLEGHRQSVDTVYANTYIANRIYGRPIFPLGQTYGGVSAAELLRFREEAVDYGATGAVVLGLAGNDREPAGARSPRRSRR